MRRSAAAVRDEWVAAAMTNDDVVVELLLRLKQAKTTSAEIPAILPPLRWGIRQRRSRSSRFGGNGSSGAGVGGSVVKKVADSARASPTTPLSWSGGSGSGGGSASPSAVTADGFEETSFQATCSTSAGSGSKVVLANEITSICSKRSTRKKTYSELKNEENSLLKQRLDLEKEIASLRATFKEQTTRNENLKRIKLDLNSDCVKSEIPDDSNGVNVEPTRELTLPSSFAPFTSQKRETTLIKERSNSKTCTETAGNAVDSDGGFFEIPDLNMTPSEDDSFAEILYGMS